MLGGRPRRRRTHGLLVSAVIPRTTPRHLSGSVSGRRPNSVWSCCSHCEYLGSGGPLVCERQAAVLTASDNPIAANAARRFMGKGIEESYPRQARACQHVARRRLARKQATSSY